MRRREFLLNLSAAVPGATLVAWPHHARAAEPTVPAGWRVFEVVTSVEVAAPSGPTQVWLPLPLGTPSDYQRLLNTSWDAPGSNHAELALVPGYDVRLL